MNVQTASVEYLTFELQTPPVRRMNRALLEFSAVRGGSIRNLTVVNSGGPGIRVDSSTSVLVDTNTVNGAGTYGIDLESSRQVLVSHNTVANSRDNAIEVGWGGTIAREAQFVDVSDNTVNGTREGAGIGVASGHEVTVQNNTLNDTHLAGVHVYGRSPIFPIDTVDSDQQHPDEHKLRISDLHARCDLRPLHPREHGDHLGKCRGDEQHNRHNSFRRCLGRRELDHRHSALANPHDDDHRKHVHLGRRNERPDLNGAARKIANLVT